MEQGGDLAKPGKIRGKAYEVLDRGCGQNSSKFGFKFWLCQE